MAQEMIKCKGCGNSVAPANVLKVVRKKVSLPEEIVELCGACRRRLAGKKLVEIGE
ncbi:MAG: hypothetical protein ABIJ27_05795 [Candidatus Omnitrophota bacterium]